MYREIEEAVAFVAGYFYYKLPRSQVNQFAVTLANALLSCGRKLNNEYQRNHGGYCNMNPETLKREITLDINARGKLAVAIIEAASIFRIPLKQISDLLPNAVKLHITEGMVSYTFWNNLICLYRSDGNMYHLHRRAYHTQLRPPLTVSLDENNRKVFQLIAKDTFPRRRRRNKHYFAINTGKQLRKAMKAAYFRCNNQELPGPIRSAK